MKVDPEEVLLDIGYKSEGVIPSRELSIKHDVNPNDVAVGDVIEALVLQKEDKDGRLILSMKRAQYERAWGKIEEIYTNDSTVTGTVIEVLKGGLILDIGLRGYLPASLVEMRRVRDLHPFVGRELECKVIELDKNRNNVVLSRRKFLEETQSEFRREFLETLQKGEIRKGTVSSVVTFGAFVDLQRERVSLSLKATQEDPWRQFARQHYVGEFIEGRVTKLVPFGAFVKVEEGIEGLIHISELAEAHVEVPEQVVKVNDPITVKSSTSTTRAGASPCPSSRPSRPATARSPRSPRSRPSPPRTPRCRRAPRTRRWGRRSPQRCSSAARARNPTLPACRSRRSSPTSRSRRATLPARPRMRMPPGRRRSPAKGTDAG